MKVARQWRPPTVEPAESEEEPTEGEEEPTEGGEESTEGEEGSTAAVALQGCLEGPLRRPPAGDPTEGREDPTEGVEKPAASTPMEAIVHPWGGADSGTLKHEMGVRSDAMMAGPEAVFFPPKRSKDLDTGCGARRAGRVLS